MDSSSPPYTGPKSIEHANRERSTDKKLAIKLHMAFPPNRFISSCSKKYIRNVFTCGNNPRLNNTGKNKITIDRKYVLKLKKSFHMIAQPNKFSVAN